MRHISTITAPLVVIAFWSASASALPVEVGVSDTDDDATVSVSVMNQAIDGDVRSHCSITIRVESSLHDFTAGDNVEVWVYEDDLLDNDLLWSTEFEVTAQEISAGLVDRTLNCSSNFFFDDDPGDNIEIFAEARANKDTCGLACFNNDHPKTDKIEVPVVDDDPGEEDDRIEDALAVGQGLEVDRISRDDDWVSFTIENSTAQVELEILHNGATGPLDATLFDDAGATVSQAVDTADGSAVPDLTIEPGDYRVRISPRTANDYNFYDIYLNVSQSDCTPGAEQERPCGDCGFRSRTCQPDGTWGSYAACDGEGECSPGAGMVESCGVCGEVSLTCTDSCQWEQGSCNDGTECTTGETEDNPCETGTRTRTCDAPGCWGEFGQCSDPAGCTDGQTRPCWSGEPEHRGVGECHDGTEECNDGGWGECRHEGSPTAEVCDGADNDCNGEVDEDVCSVSGGDIGDSCAASADCEGYDCITSDAHPQFRGGYCGTENCFSDGDCGPNGLCRSVFGTSFCLKKCSAAGDCRSDYLCAAISNARVCIPSCLSDSDCEAPDRPMCDGASGLCVNSSAPTNNNNNTGTDTGTTGDPDAGGDAGTPPPGAGGSEDDGCGCSTVSSPTSKADAVLLLLGLVAVVAGRRLRPQAR